MPVTVRYRVEALTLHVMRAVADLLPARWAPRCGAGLGRLVCAVWRRRRRIAHDNLRRAFPELPDRDVGRLVRRTFSNLGVTAFEILRSRRETRETILARVDANGADCLEQAFRDGRGALLMTGHLGNWELFGGWVRAMGYPVDVVVKPVRNPLVDRMYNACRARFDVGIIHTQTATREIIRSLHRKRFVAMLADQYAGQEGVEVEFFGRKTSTPRGPATLALKYGCPILTGVLVRRPDGRHFADVDGPLVVVPTGDFERDVTAITQEYTRRLEQHIRRCPDQWLWTHRRWRDGR